MKKIYDSMIIEYSCSFCLDEIKDIIEGHNFKDIKEARKYFNNLLNK